MQSPEQKPFATFLNIITLRVSSPCRFPSSIITHSHTLSNQKTNILLYHLLARLITRTLTTYTDSHQLIHTIWIKVGSTMR